MKKLFAQTMWSAVLAASAFAVVTVGPLTSNPAVALRDWFTFAF